MTERYLKREIIVHQGFTFDVSTTSADLITWTAAYLNGYREAKHPLPVPLDIADDYTAWFVLERYGVIGWLMWLDHMEAVFDVTSCTD